MYTSDYNFPFKTIGDVCLVVIKLIAKMNEIGVHEPIYITQPCILTDTKHIPKQKNSCQHHEPYPLIGLLPIDLPWWNRQHVPFRKQLEVY